MSDRTSTEGVDTMGADARPRHFQDALRDQLRGVGPIPDPNSLLAHTVDSYRRASAVSPDVVPLAGTDEPLLTALADYVDRHGSAPLASEIVVLGEHPDPAAHGEPAAHDFAEWELELMSRLASLSATRSSFLWDDAVSIVALRVWTMMRREWDAGGDVGRLVGVHYLKRALRNEHSHLLVAHQKRTRRTLDVAWELEPPAAQAPEPDHAVLQLALVGLRVLGHRTSGPRLSPRQVAAFMNRLAGEHANKELATAWGVSSSAISHDAERAAEQCALVVYLCLALAPPAKPLDGDEGVHLALDLYSDPGSPACTSEDRLVLGCAGPAIRLDADSSLRASVRGYLRRLGRSSSQKAARLVATPVTAVDTLHESEARYARCLPGATTPLTFWCVARCDDHQPGRNSHGR